MKTVKYLAEKNCKVKVKGKYYSGNQVIPTELLSEDEIKQLIAAKFIRKLELEEGGGEKSTSAKKGNEKSDEGSGSGAGAADNANTGAGNENAASAGTGEASGNSGEKPLEQMSKEELKALAEKLGVKVGFTDSEEKIRQKIKEVQGAGA